MFTPDEQNLAGLELVWRDIQREATQGLKKAIRAYFVAANVPDLDDEEHILRRQLHNSLVRLGIRWISGVIRRYQNLNLLDQSVFTLDRPHTKLARSYRRILRTLLLDNVADRDGVMISLKHPTRAITLHDDNVATFQEANRNRLHKIARHYNDDIEILNRVATALSREDDYKSAMRVFDRVLELDPANSGAGIHKAFYKSRFVEADPAVGNWPEGD
jgi:tetratricopeptide (TPR) repeat protein